MLFNSKLFVLAFLPLALGGFFALGRCGRRAAMLWLLACSLVFYAWGNPACLLLLLASIGGTEESWEHTHQVSDARFGPQGWDETGTRARRLSADARRHVVLQHDQPSSAGCAPSDGCVPQPV